MGGFISCFVGFWSFCNNTLLELISFATVNLFTYTLLFIGPSLDLTESIVSHHVPDKDKCEVHEIEIVKLTQNLRISADEIILLQEENAALKAKLLRFEIENRELKNELYSSQGIDAGSNQTRGPKPRDFEELSRIQQRRVTQVAFDALKDVATERNVDIVNLTGYMMKRASHMSDKTIADVGSKVEKGESVCALRKLEHEHCLWMLTFGEDMGKYQWRKFKASLKDFVFLESFETLSLYWKQNIMCPIRNIYQEEKRDIMCGVCINPVEFIPHYLKRFLIKQEKLGNPLVAGHYKVVFKAGTDGGRHGWFRWYSGPVPSSKNPTQSISLYDLMLLSVTSASGTPAFEWREQRPCSDRVTRVLSVIMAEEKDSVLLKMVQYMQRKQNDLLEGFTVVHNDEEFVFVPRFIDRNDKKMDRLLTGIGDGCDNCVAPPKSWSDLIAIEAGFPKDRTLASIKSTYETLEKNEKGEIKRVTGDYEVRQGICSEPITLRETYSFTVTHKWTHVIHHIVKVITHLMVNCLNWTETKDVQVAIKFAKSRVQEALKPGKFPGGSKEDNVGVAYEYPDAKGYGGTTTTAETARKILKTKALRERLVALCPDEYQDAISEILVNALTLLNLMSCDKILYVDEVEMICKQQMKLFIENIGCWVKFPPTIHEFYAHLPQMIEENEERGLKALSEENLEALHKIVRRIRERKARMLNVEMNLTDIITRMTIRSDPVVQYFEPEVVCKVCGARGHTQISCYYSSNNTTMSCEDLKFWKCVNQNEQPGNVV